MQPITWNQQVVKKSNKSLVLQMVMEHEPLSRADIAQVTGLNKATVSSLINELLEEELVYESGAGESSGVALQWLKDLLNDQGSFEEFLHAAEQTSPGANGLVFLPYINGERAPLWNSRAKGNFYGLNVTHKKEHFIRAVLEGITFNLYQIGKELEELTGKPQKIYVNGGLSRSPLWLQILADVFETEILVPESYHSAAWGAAWVSLVAIGKVNSFEEIKRNIPMSKAIFPNKNNSVLYKEIYKQYTSLEKDIMKYFQ